MSDESDETYGADETRSSHPLTTVGPKDLMPSVVAATLGAELGSGKYNWAKLQVSGKPVGPGPMSGECREMNNSTGIVSTNVFLFRVGREWLFQFPVKAC